MDSSAFVNDEDVPVVNQHEDYDDYNKLNTSRIDETSFTVPDATEATSTLQLRQKVKRDMLTALDRNLNVTDNLDLIDLDRFRLTTDQKKRVTISEFYNGDR